MASSSCMFITQPVLHSKKCSGTKWFSSCPDYAKSSWVLPIYCYGAIYPRLHLDRSYSARKTLKHHTRARRSESEWEEKEGEEESEKEKEDKKEDHPAEETVLKLYSDIKDQSIDGISEVTGKEGQREEDRPEETVLKLYDDIKNRNIDGISEAIGDECRFSCNFSSTYRLLQGKKQVMAFFYWLITKLGKDIKIVVKPTSKDGMTVGVQWQLEWEKPKIQLGKGVSFHICHIYQGRLLIKNVEMFMEPIFHMEPLRLRTIAFAVSLAEKIATCLKPTENIRRKAMILLLLALLLLAAAAFYFTRPGF